VNPKFEISVEVGRMGSNSTVTTRKTPDDQGFFHLRNHRVPTPCPHVAASPPPQRRAPAARCRTSSNGSSASLRSCRRWHAVTGGCDPPSLPWACCPPEAEVSNPRHRQRRSPANRHLTGCAPTAWWVRPTEVSSAPTSWVLLRTPVHELPKAVLEVHPKGRTGISSARPVLRRWRDLPRIARGP
jgi:hypothetical protein